ncbi:hypothetical protein [Streptomyces carpinensis]|uniref:Uncharacterized protein n=1 Tax=Streptomyces carpinensis TaxID=66369 RepID=A0ABV1VVR7_9ACTN|nr:hypothetical protein [Streptomyces carpinensis]
MADSTAEETPARFQLGPDRLKEVRQVLARLGAVKPPADADLRRLLADCRTALAEVLDEREGLVRANAEAAEELALWTGALG